MATPTYTVVEAGEPLMIRIVSDNAIEFNGKPVDDAEFLINLRAIQAKTPGEIRVSVEEGVSREAQAAVLLAIDAVAIRPLRSSRPELVLASSDGGTDRFLEQFFESKPHWYLRGCEFPYYAKFYSAERAKEDARRAYRAGAARLILVYMGFAYAPYRAAEPEEFRERADFTYEYLPMGIDAMREPCDEALEPLGDLPHEYAAAFNAEMSRRLAR